MEPASRRLWRTSPLTYVALVLATLLSIYPFYYMIVIATRSLDSITSSRKRVRFAGVPP